MPLINKDPKRMGNLVVTEFVDSVGVDPVAFSIPDNIEQEMLQIYNISPIELLVSVGTQSNVSVPPYQGVTLNEAFTSFSIKSSLGVGGFRATCSYEDSDEEDEVILGDRINQLTTSLADITPYLFPKNSVGNTNGTLQNWQWDTTQRINMVAIGDSITEGAWGDLSTLNWPTTGWVGKLRAALQRIYGDGGRGFIGLWRPEWTKVGTWTNNPDFAPWGSCYYATSNTATYTLNNVYGDNAEIYYVNNSAVTFSVSVDGGTAQTITSSSPYTNQSIKVAISLGTLGNHSIQIIGPTSGTLFLQGASVYNGTSGIVLHNLGRSSTRAYEAQLRFDDRFSMMKTHFPAKLTFLNLLANDFTQQNISSSYLDAYKTNMNTIASKIKGIGSDLIVWQPPDNTAAPTATTWSVEQYENESKNVAIANNGAWVNVHTAWGKWSDNVPRMYDTQHPNAQGMKDIAALMFKVLRITS